MAKEYIEREVAKSELLSWAVSINHPEYLIKDDALHVIDSIPAADVECCGRLRGVTYEDGKIIDVHIRDTDDVVKIFVPVRHGRWIEKDKYAFGTFYDCSICGNRIHDNGHSWNYCPNCGADMRGSNDEKVREDRHEAL